MNDLFESDSKYELLQVRCTVDLKEDIVRWCRERGLTLSVFIRMVCAKVINDSRGSGDMRTLQPIDTAVQQVLMYLPTILKYGMQKKY